MKKTLLRASAANNTRNRIAEQCFHEIITVYLTVWRRLWPVFFVAVTACRRRQSYPAFFGVSPRRAAMLQLSSPMTSVRPASLFSMRTSKNQLSTMGKPKSLIKPNTSETSILATLSMTGGAVTQPLRPW